MKLLAGSVLLIVCVGCGLPRMDDRENQAQQIVEAANMWTEGKAVPDSLLSYSSSYSEGSCFPLMSGTESLVACITNYSLLKEIALLPSVDSRIFSNVVTRALVVGGPNRFFGDLKEERRIARALEAQIGTKHVVVESLYIDFTDMPPESAKSVLNEIKKELERGKPFEKVYWEYSERFEYPTEEKLSDGTVVRSTRTKIGNLGNFVLPSNENPLFSYREEWMPTDHLRPLFGARAGDVLILFDKEDLSRYPDAKGTGERYVLHQVREVYPQ